MSSTPPPPPGPPVGAPAGYPPPGSYPPQPYGYGYAPARLPFKRNAMLIVAQVLAIIQGSFGLLAGLGIIVLGIVGGSVIQNVINNSSANGRVAAGAAVGFVIGFGVVLAILAIVVIFCAVRAGHPSQAARWVLAVIEILFLLASISGLGRASFSVTVNGQMAGGNSFIWSIVTIVWEALIIIGLIVDPNTYRAYARRNLPGNPTVARGV